LECRTGKKTEGSSPAFRPKRFMLKGWGGKGVHKTPHKPSIIGEGEPAKSEERLEALRRGSLRDNTQKQDSQSVDRLKGNCSRGEERTKLRRKRTKEEKIKKPSRRKR